MYCQKPNTLNFKCQLSEHNKYKFYNCSNKDKTKEVTKSTNNKNIKKLDNVLLNSYSYSTPLKKNSFNNYSNCNTYNDNYISNYSNNYFQFMGPYYPYIPPPDYQWHEQMKQYIIRMSKINKMSKKLRNNYNQHSTILNEYVKPKVYAIKSLLDNSKMINFRREHTYRDLVRGDYNLKNFEQYKNSYSYLIENRSLVDMDTLKGSNISDHKNINDFKLKVREALYSNYKRF